MVNAKEGMVDSDHKRGDSDEGDENQVTSREIGDTKEELLALHSQNTALREEVKELKTQLSHLTNQLTRLADMSENNFQTLNASIQSIAKLPVRSVQAKKSAKSTNSSTNSSGTNGGTNNDTNNDTNNSTNKVAVDEITGEEFVTGLSPSPDNLEVLWKEYQDGVSGRKPARMFTAKERGRVKDKYHRRKVVWDVVKMRVKSGETAEEAIEKIYDIYGRNQNISKIINMMLRDRRDHNGTCHPELYMKEVES